jgi:uncharacterized protein (TIGR02996 family)
VNEWDAFLKALAENEDDTTTRLVFADWLDERGVHEEADRQRKWPAAKQWLIKFCEDHNPRPDEEGRYEQVISYDDLIEMGRSAINEVLSSRRYDQAYESPEQMLASGWETLEVAGLIESADQWEFHFGFANNIDMCEAMWGSASEFWKNWSVVTGIPLPPGVEEKSHFHCSC